MTKTYEERLQAAIAELQELTEQIQYSETPLEESKRHLSKQNDDYNEKKIHHKKGKIKNSRKKPSEGEVMICLKKQEKLFNAEVKD